MSVDREQARRDAEERWSDPYTRIAAYERLVELLDAGLEQAERELDETRESLTTLRTAWNHHMDGCEQHKSLPVLPPPTAEDIQRWMNAPSDTASGPTLAEWRQRALRAEAQLAAVPALVDDALQLCDQHISEEQRKETQRRVIEWATKWEQAR